MKQVKMLGLAAIAAMALMAFLGAGAASATELWKGGNPGTTMTVGEEIAATLESGTSASLTSPTESVIATCTGSEIEGEITEDGSASTTVKGKVETLSFSSCSTSVTVKSLGELEIHHQAGTDNGTVTGIGFDIVATVFGVECGYGAGSGTTLGTLTGTLEAEKQATLDISATVSKVTGGFLCPSTAKWTASYSVTSPTGLNVASEAQEKVDLELKAPAFKVGVADFIEVKNIGDVEWSREKEEYDHKGHTEGTWAVFSPGTLCEPKTLKKDEICKKKLQCEKAGVTTWTYKVITNKGVKAEKTLKFGCT